MTIDADPNSSFPVVLREHEQLPEAEQPVLYFRRCTRRDSKVIQRLMAEIDGYRKDREAAKRDSGRVFQLYDDIETFLRERLVGWSNQTDETGAPLPFDIDDFDRIVDESQLMELAMRFPQASAVSFAEKKASGSPSPSSTGSAASSATTDATQASGPNSNAPAATDGGAMTATTPGTS